MKLLITGLLMLIAILGGLFLGFGSIAYGIYLLILLIKGTIAVSFWTLFKIVFCWFAGSLMGWAWFIFWTSIAGMVGASIR